MNISFSSSQFQQYSCNSCNINTSYKLLFYASSISSTSLLEVVYSDVWTSPILFVERFKLPQQEYFVDLLSKHNMLDSKLVMTLLTVGSPLSAHDGSLVTGARHFRQVLGGLQLLQW